MTPERGLYAAISTAIRLCAFVGLLASGVIAEWFCDEVPG